MKTALDFTGSDSDRIQAAVECANNNNGNAIVPAKPDGSPWLLDRAILLPSHTTLVLQGCHLKLSDRCRDNFIRTANCGMNIVSNIPAEAIQVIGEGDVLLEGAEHPRSTGDGGKTCSTNTRELNWKRSFGTDEGVEGESQQGDWRNIGILLANVSGFSISGITLKNYHCWGISLEKCVNGKVADINFIAPQNQMINGELQTCLNRDGLDLRSGCRDIEIDNITGDTGDDIVALTSIVSKNRDGGGLAVTEVSANSLDAENDIRNVTIRNVRGKTKCAMIRLLCSENAPVHDVTIQGLYDLSPDDARTGCTLRIGETDTRYCVQGTIYNISVSDVVSNANKCVLMLHSLKNAHFGSITNNNPDTDTVFVN
ncbi:MAG: hypothetical protein IJS15_12905 [Victivallales bacterium]|nr:hypothetical protein [Victivallales bacterium]